MRFTISVRQLLSPDRERRCRRCIFIHPRTFFRAMLHRTNYPKKISSWTTFLLSLFSFLSFIKLSPMLSFNLFFLLHFFCVLSQEQDILFLVQFLSSSIKYHRSSSLSTVICRAARPENSSLSLQTYLIHSSFLSLIQCLMFNVHVSPRRRVQLEWNRFHVCS